MRNQSQNAFFRYSQRAVTYFQPPPYPGPVGGNSNGTLYARTRQLVGGYNWTLTSSSILELRFGETWTESGKQPIFLEHRTSWRAFRTYLRIRPTQVA